MSRKLRQIIAVRENTWIIHIPMGCDLKLSRAATTQYCSWLSAPAQKFLGKKINELGPLATRPKDSIFEGENFVRQPQND